MENTITPTDQEVDNRYFETYVVKETDIAALEEGIKLTLESNLYDPGVLKEIRFVTYDSKHLYIFTQGTHASTEKFKVETLKTGDVNIYKIPHDGTIGKTKDDYQGAMAWLLCDEIETTVVTGTKFPNGNKLKRPKIPQPDKVLNVVRMAPLEPYEKIQNGRCNYLTDVIFHEAGHIEHRRLENWQEGEPVADTFPSFEQRAKFISTISQTNILLKPAVDQIIEHITYSAISEMYAMFIDNEAAKHYDTKHYEMSNRTFLRRVEWLNNPLKYKEGLEQFFASLKSGHKIASILVRILEAEIPDFTERKKFIQSVLKKQTV